MSKIDARLLPDDPEARTPGEAIQGMSLQGGGWANRPWALPPHFVATKPRARRWRPGVEAAMCHRFTRGRTLEEVAPEGWDRFWSALTLAVWQPEAMDQRCHHLDPTRFARTGADVPASDAPAMATTHGSSKDQRPALQQAVWARRVSQDGGGPGASKRWDGHAADTQSVHERAAAWLAPVQGSPTPRSRRAESTRASADHAAPCKPLGLITRIPGTLTRVSQGISPARRGATWPPVDATTRSQRLELCHDGMVQRWGIVSAEAALQRAEQRVSTAQKRALAIVQQPRWHVPAQRCEPPASAHAA